MKRELLLQLQSDIENVTDAWLSTALKSLLLIQSRSEQRLLFSKHLLGHILCSKLSKVRSRHVNNYIKVTALF